MEEDKLKRVLEQGKFEGSVLTSLSDIKKQLRDFEKRHAELALEIEALDKRIRILENWKSWMLGAMGAASLIGGIIGALMNHLIF